MTQLQAAWARTSLRLISRLLTVFLVMGLAACHHFTTLNPRPASSLPNLNISDGDLSELASLHCMGGVGCQFLTLNGVQLLNEQSGEPTEHGKTDGILRYESPNLNASSQYYLAVIPAPHDVDVQFFPISRARAEYFSFTHRFRAGHRYDLNLYRQPREQSGSLLSLAGPAPLCVDLLDNGVIERRFCRSYDFQASSTTFVEQKIK